MFPKSLILSLQIKFIDIDDDRFYHHYHLKKKDEKYVNRFEPYQ